MISPRTKEGIKSLAWIAAGFVAVPAAIILLPWTPWLWLLLPFSIFCAVMSWRAAVTADQTYGWPMSPRMKAEWDALADERIRKRRDYLPPGGIESGGFDR